METKIGYAEFDRFYFTKPITNGVVNLDISWGATQIFGETGFAKDDYKPLHTNSYIALA